MSDLLGSVSIPRDPPPKPTAEASSNVIEFPQDDPRDDPRYAGPIEPMQPGDDIDAATIVCADIVCGQITRTKLGFAASCVHRGFVGHFKHFEEAKEVLGGNLKNFSVRTEPEEISEEEQANRKLLSIVEHVDLAASWARSAAEAAWRGNRSELRYYLHELRRATIGAIAAFKQLGSERGDAA
jgi:hypothetical protein